MSNAPDVLGCSTTTSVSRCRRSGGGSRSTGWTPIR